MYKSSFQSSRLGERRYKQMLEEEQKSLARNKKLLEDIDNLEEDMRCFSHECRQDEERLNHAKTKFMNYVKSVYPKWKEDVKKWKEEMKHHHNDEKRNGPFASRQSDLHSTPHRKHFGLERSPPHSVPNPGASFIDYPSDRLVVSRDTVGFGGEELRYPKDNTGSYMDSKTCTNDTIGHSRDRNESYMFRSGYTRDMMSYPNDRMGSSFDRMTYPRNRNSRSFREATELSWDEMAFTRGYPRNNIGYPRMYNSGPWMYPHTTPSCMFPHSAHHYFGPVSVPYGVPRWSTPGYDHLSNPYGYEDNGKNERQGYSGNDNLQNVSFERDGRGQREVLPSARNSELYQDERKEPCSSNVDDFVGHPSAKHLPNDDRYPTERLNHSYENGAKRREPSPKLGRLSRDADEQRDMQVDETCERDSRGLEHFRAPEGERHRQLQRKMDGRTTMDGNDERRIQQKNDEELTDRTTISEPFDAVKVNNRKEYPGELVQDAGLTQLRNKGAGSGSREATDSISLPTIHQYEGDPRDIFSDMSDSEPLNQTDRKQMQDDDRALESAVPKQDGNSRIVRPKVKDYSDTSGVRKLHQGGSGQVDGKHSKEKNPLSNIPSRGEDSVSRADTKHFAQNIGPKLAQGKKSSAPERSLKREVSESKSSVVEDLIGDDVSDFEVSEAELPDDDLGGREPIGETLVSENANEESEGLRPGVDNGTEVNDERKKPGGVISENKAECKQVGENEISNESLPEDREAKSSSPNESKSQETRKRILPQEPSEILEAGIDSHKEDVAKQNNGDKGFSYDGHSSDESIAEELAKTASDHTGSKGKTDENLRESKVQENLENTGLKDSTVLDSKHDAKSMAGTRVDSFKDRRHSNEHQEDIETKSPTNAEGGFAVKRDSMSESGEADLGLERNTGKPAVNEGEESVEEILSEDEKSKSVVLEEVSFSSVESSSESASVKKNNASKMSESKTRGLSYSEDFEDEKSIPLTQSAAYQKMLSTVDVSDEGDDLEEDFLEGTMSEANTTAQGTNNMPQSLQNSTTKLSVKLNPTLTLFSSGERDDLGNSVGSEGVGVLSASWKSSEGSLSPPLSPDPGGYAPSVPAAGKVEDKKAGGGKEVLPADEKNGGKVETGKKLQESDTKSRIQAGFWNHSDSEPEVDLQISHGGNDNDDDDDFDFYS